MGMKPAGHGFAKGILQGDLGTICHLQGLALRDPSQPSLRKGKRGRVRERRIALASPTATPGGRSECSGSGNFT